MAQSDRDVHAVRWAGAGLAVSGGVMFVTTLLFGSVFGALAATEQGLGITAAGWADHILDGGAGLAWAWSIELVAQLVLAVSGLTLMRQASGGTRWLPQSVAWSFVMIGAVLQAVVYAFMLGGSPAAVGVVESDPALLQALTGAAALLVRIGMGAVFVGIGGVLVTGAEAVERIPTRVGRVSGMACFGGAVILLAGAMGMVPSLVVAPVALVARALTAYLGIQIFRSAVA